ncbi:hypothetical protein [Larkinella rosea]|uniref:VanZ-like domain-containing protein n=1 Tax=Larkinella rosea TaxID=2025312 RepID=A0A3P1BIY5_9BACT|nr:hypothetical protein [Larkinella rosea]RRB00955.1 hypothetical protein EHT25_22490 [Larkinella rosea]
MRFSFLLLIVLGISLVFYLSWVPSPYMRVVWFLPGWVARWADVGKNADLRTAVPFVFLGFCSGFMLFRSQAAWFWWLFACFGLTLVAVIAEVGQLALPHRHFSWTDIQWGAAGSVLGMMGALIVGFVSRQFRIGNPSE